MNHEIWIEMAEIYAAGALDGEDLSRFEYHMTQCPPCCEYVIEIEKTLTVFPQCLNMAFPSPDVKETLMRKISCGSPAGSRSLVFASVAAFVVLGGIAAVLAAGFMHTRHKLHDMNGLAFQLNSPDVKTIPMQGLEPSPNASAKLLMDMQNEKCILVGTHLSPLPQGQVYELWGMKKGGELVAAGTFTVDKNGCAVFNVPVIPGMKDFEKFAVTAEPLGGRPQPTGAMHLLGTV